MWASRIDPDELIKEMLALKASLEDFANRMERVERVLFENQTHRTYRCGTPGCDGSLGCLPE